MKQLFLVVAFLTLSFGEFIKSENIVLDKEKKLMWQDNIEVTYQEDITMGKTYCEELVLNGYIDWKLPTIKQLQSLLDQDSKVNHLNKTFEFFKDGDYYSITPNVTNNMKYWYINFSTGLISSKDKESLGFIRCVRKIK